MTTDTQDFSQLRALAEAASSEMKAWFDLDDKGWCFAGEAYDAQAFIAAANPATVIALMNALEAMQAEVAQAKFSYMNGYEGGKQEPACWGMPHADGRIYDVICSEEHAKIEGRYTVPLFAAAGASPQPVLHRDALVVNLLRLTSLDKHTARAIADAAISQPVQPSQAVEVEPLGYVVEHNVPPQSSGKWSFHPASQGLSFYKDTALVITPVYTTPPDTEALESPAREYQRNKNKRLRAALDAMPIAQPVQPTPPPECKTEAEKTAFAFGWWKALETVQPSPARGSNAISATRSFFNNEFGQSIPTVTVSFQPNDWNSRDAFASAAIAAINAKETK